MGFRHGLSEGGTPRTWNLPESRHAPEVETQQERQVMAPARPLISGIKPDDRVPRRIVSGHPAGRDHSGRLDGFIDGVAHHLDLQPERAANVARLDESDVPPPSTTERPARAAGNLRECAVPRLSQISGTLDEKLLKGEVLVVVGCIEPCRAVRDLDLEPAMTLLHDDGGEGLLFFILFRRKHL